MSRAARAVLGLAVAGFFGLMRGHWWAVPGLIPAAIGGPIYTMIKVAA